jgi:hypothetical protein
MYKNKMENILYQDLQHINHTYWNLLHKEWGIKVDKYKHRSEIKEIKDELYKKLGYIFVFYFLNEKLLNMAINVLTVVVSTWYYKII